MSRAALPRAVQVVGHEADEVQAPAGSTGGAEDPVSGVGPPLPF